MSSMHVSCLVGKQLLCFKCLFLVTVQEMLVGAEKHSYIVLRMQLVVYLVLVCV